MAKTNCTQTRPLNQDTIHLYHNAKSINDPQFDLEDSFCARLNKIRAIADMFYVMGGADDRSLTSEGAFGLHRILEGEVEELRAICYHMFENLEVSK